MSRSIARMGLLTACACASTGGPTPDVAVVPISDRIVTGGGRSITIGSSATTVGIAGDVAAKPDDVFKALQAVYEDLKIPLTDVSSSSRVVGNQQFRTRRRIGGVPMQTYLDCGGNPGQPNAETYNIVLNMMSFVAAGKNDGSTVTTRIQAVASDPGHGEANQMRCSSTSELETRIARLVREKLAPK